MHQAVDDFVRHLIQRLRYPISTWKNSKREVSRRKRCRSGEFGKRDPGEYNPRGRGPKRDAIQMEEGEAEKISRKTRSPRGNAEKEFRLKRKEPPEQIQPDKAQLEKIRLKRSRAYDQSPRWLSIQWNTKPTDPQPPIPQKDWRHTP